MRIKLKDLLEFSILLIFWVGCAHPKAYYDIGLHEVERPIEAKERYGKQTITSITEEGVEKYFFEDEMVKIIWIPSQYRISFILTNKTDHSIKIVWDEAAYVDENGISHRVVHSGVKYADLNTPQPPSVVVRKSTIGETLHPTDYVYYLGGDVGWRDDPLLPDLEVDFKADISSEEVKGKASKYIGKTIQVLLPLQIENVVNEYIFTFKVHKVVVK